MLIDKVRELDKKLTHAVAVDSSEGFAIARNELIGLIPEMAQALIRVDEVLERPRCLNDGYRAYIMDLKDIRKALEGNNQEEQRHDV